MSAAASPLDSWTAGASGHWSAPSNWGLRRAPKTGYSVQIEGGAPLVVTFDVGPLSLSGFALVNATLTLLGAGSPTRLTVTGAALFQNATLNGAGPVTLAGASTIQGLDLGGSAQLVNKGTATQSGAAIAIGDGAASTAAIVNSLGATWVVSDASGMTQGAATGWRFYNNGTFQKTSGSGIALIEANFMSTGTIASAGGGDIEFDGKFTSLSGTYIGAGMVDYGPDGVARIGNVNVTQASCQSNWGTVNLVGTMTMHDGSTIMNAAGAHWNFAGDGSLLLAAGEAAGPDINGMGVIAKTAGTGTSHVGVIATAEGVVFVSTGTLSFEGATSTFSSTVAGAGTFQIGGGAATIAAGARLTVAHWTLAGGVTTLGENVRYAGAFTVEAGATLNLNGYTLTSTGSATLAAPTTTGAVAPAANASAPEGASTLGAVRVSSGALDFKGAVYGSGSVEVAGAATLEFDNYVEDANVLFSGSGGVLRLQDLADFHGSIGGLTGADALLIGGGWTFEGATHSASAATLSFAEGSLHSSLTLLGDYAGAAFSAATASGQVKLTF